MKISYEKQGVEGIENCLAYLAAFDADDIESDEFEIIGEDEEGREGSADISIINLAEEACRALAAQRKRIAHLEAEVEQHAAAEGVQIALRQKMEGERDALAAHVGRIKAEERRAYVGGLSMPGILHSIIHQHPDTSLTRRDLIKQAEVLEVFAAGLPKFNHMGVEKALLIKSRALRRQAEAQ